MTWQFWIDRGGTFTDVIAQSEAGTLQSIKLLSDNPQQYQDAALAGIRQILNCSKQETIPTDTITSVKMGTTVATNALLERHGEPTVLVTSQGFKDVLRIGYQNRPKLFALKIALPQQLYHQVIEIEERVDAKGAVIIKLNKAQAKTALQQAFDAGARSLAIVFMHGYRYPEHEKRIASLAKEIGFPQISVSHETMPVMKFISRGDTTVVDAYLSPLLKRYIASIKQELKQTQLMFMQSNGGLVNAEFFQGKDSILSGPAGGVVGMVKTAQEAGYDKVIGFDMGGTSTDVSHFAGDYERSYEAEIAGVKLRSPMMLIHTIAAGGGSILNFANGRFTVGPDSAGANPGPACYRRGGPLTITDCNVLLGKIQADHFPNIFGTKANESLDTNIVKEKFKKLAEKISNETNDKSSPEQVAAGFLQVAVENMANAIKKISVQRGYNVTDYLLNCFGGAAGQHACLVADALNIKKVLLHPLAGVLSAYGMGMAELRSIHAQGVEAELTTPLIPQLQRIINKLAAVGKEVLQKQGIASAHIKVKQRAHIRYLGSDTVLVVDFGSEQEMKTAFQQVHQQQFGFNPVKRSLVIDTLSVEVIGDTHTIKKTSKKKQTKRSQENIRALATVKVFTQNKWQDAPIYHRQDLQAGDCIKGLSIIIEANATTVIEPEWQAEISNVENLILTRIKPLQQQKAIGTDIDPIMLEIFNNRFMAIAEQMGVVLRNTASSVNIKERLDFSCALFNKVGDLIANAPHIPVHLGSMSESVKSIYEQRQGSIKPGDVYMLNAPYNGGTHLPDVTVITPVFNQEGSDLLFFVASRGHHADIGGKTPGSMPADSKTVEEEGVLIDNLKVVSEGEFLEQDLYDLLTNNQYPARNPQQNIEDFKAQIAANQKGVSGLYQLIDEFGLATVNAYMEHVRANAAASVRALLHKLKSGSFSYEMDNGSQVVVKVTIAEDKHSACIDFTGTSLQLTNNFNAPTAVCKAAILYVLRCLVATEIPLNGGCLEPIDIIIPPGTMLNPQYPAAVVAGNVETSQCIVDALFGALGVMGAAQGTCNNFTFGNQQYQYYETICGGAGAGSDFAGASAVHTHITNTRLTDPEVLEWRFPVLLESFSIREHSGGQGIFNGGDGAIRKIKFLQPMLASIVSSHRKIPTYGMQGGKPGKIGHNWIQRVNGSIKELQGCDFSQMQAGDVFVIETPGGGGYGEVVALVNTR